MHPQSLWLLARSLVAKEADVYLYKEPEPGKGGSGGRDTAIKVTAEKAGGASLAASSTWGGGGAAACAR